MKGFVEETKASSQRRKSDWLSQAEAGNSSRRVLVSKPEIDNSEGTGESEIKASS